MASKNPAVREIEKEAKRRSLADDGKSSHAERFAIRAQLRDEAGLGKEQRVRGGLARIYDNEKSWLTPVAAALLGATGIGGAFAPALLGAAQGGLDRPGEGGIGFDVGGALKGGLSGAAAGSVGKFAGGILNPAPAASLAGAGGGSAANAVASAPLDQIANAGVTLGPAPASSFLSKIGGAVSNGFDWLKGDGGLNALKLGQGIATTLQGKKANDQVDRAVALDTKRWGQGAPLRTAGMEGLLHPVPAVDTSALARLAGQGNPFAAPVPARRAR